MPEIICPICDTPNPADAVICSMCHSRLSTTPGTTRSLTSPSDEPPQDKENLDWLERVRALNAMDQLEKYGVTAAPSGPVNSESAPEPIPEVENPDWLHNTRDLNSDQKPPSPETPGEDLSWLNDLRASTGSLGPPTPGAASASATLAAAAMAQHQAEEVDQKPGETQELTPLTAIPGSASDWLDKLGAVEDGAPLKPGFEDRFGSPPRESGPVIEYDIDRATGSLKKSTEASQLAVEIPEEPLSPPSISTPSSPSTKEEDQKPVTSESQYASTGKPGTDDLAFLDTLIASTAVSGLEQTREEEPPSPRDSQPPDGFPAQEPETRDMPFDVPGSTPSWLQDIQNLPETGESKPTSEMNFSESTSISEEVVSVKSLESHQVQDLRDVFRDSFKAEVLPDAGLPALDSQSPNKEGILPPSFQVDFPSNEGSPLPVPGAIPAAEFDARILNQFVAAPVLQEKPPEIKPPEGNPDLGQFPGFSPLELDDSISNESGMDSELGGILPPDLKTDSTPAIFSETPAKQSIPEVSEQVEGSQAVDIASILPSEETPDWLKQYSGDFVVDEDQASLFPTQGSINQDLPGSGDYSTPEILEVVAAPAEIQGEDWLNTVINETPATPLDLYKDVEEPRFAPAEESSPSQEESENKPSAWVVEPGQHTGFTGPLPDWLQELEVSQDAPPETSLPSSIDNESLPDLFNPTPPSPSPDLRSAFPAVEPIPESGIEGIPLSDLGISAESIFPADQSASSNEKMIDGVALSEMGIDPESIFTSPQNEGKESIEQAEWLSDIPPTPEPVNVQELPSPVPQSPQPSQEERIPPAAASIPAVRSLGQSTTSPPSPSPHLQTPASPGVPFGMESLPDWISAESSESGTGSSMSGDQSGLAHAEMPGWLEALKPVGMAAAAFGKRTPAPEKNPSATGSANRTTDSFLPKQNVAPPPSASIPISPIPPGSETQKQYAAMMDQVLTQETPFVAPDSQVKKRRNPLIWIIVVSVVLVLLLLLAAFGLGFLPMPQLFSADTVSFYNTVENLPDDAAVLIALDYVPAFSAELQPISQTLMDQLVAKEARISFVSTQPSGPFFAEQLIQQVSDRFPGYDLAGKTANMGYLAGGASGLQEFSIHPTVAVSKGWDGQLVWSKPALSGVTDLDKFSSVIVFSDSMDSARNWIEQVQPMLGEVPLLIASSAQTWPQLQPYSASNQVKGLVAGISGGVAYGSILGKNDSGSDLWGLYLFGQILAILTILLGVTIRIYNESKHHNSPGKGS